MILILSKGEFETSTEDVIDWLDSLGGKWRRVNGCDLEKNRSMMVVSNGEEITLLGDDIDPLPKFNVVWYRRWFDSFPHSHFVIDNNMLSFELKANLIFERKKLRQTFFNSLKSVRWLSYPDDHFSKTTVLSEAAKVGLRIPDTYILNSKGDLEKLLSRGHRLITKCIGESPIFYSKDFAYLLYTAEFIKDYVDIPDRFHPTLFQERIEKDYELRIFYLNGAFYSMAIFSQTNPQTVDDFRQYDDLIPNRRVPYRLPLDIQERLLALMKAMNLETGSIDMIKSKDGIYFFLEVNPVGQFGMTSRPCNFNIEKRIAEYLLLNDIESDG